MMPRLMQPVDFNILRANTSSDPRQVPASGATLAVYLLGATVTEAVTVYDWGEASVSVGSQGDIQTGDVLQPNADSSLLMDVVGVTDGGQTLVLVAEGSTPITLSPGDRLFLVSRTPQLYADSSGTLAISGHSVTVTSLGFARFYTPQRSVDCIVTGGGLPSALPYQDIQAGWVQAARPTLNVLDYPSFQAAHDALPDSGGTIFVPAGSYTSESLPTAFTGLIISKANIALIGESDGPWSSLSVLEPSSDETDAIEIAVTGGVLIKNLYIKWPDEATEGGAGRGIRWYKPGPAAKCANVEIVNVIVHKSPNLAFEFVCDGYIDTGEDETCYISKLVMIDCLAYDSRSGGSMLLGGGGSNNNFLERCEFNGPGFGWYRNVNGCGLTASDTTVTVSGDDFVTVAVGDEVTGMGVAIGTTVASVSSSEIELDQPAVSSITSTTLSFYRATDTPSSERTWNPRGHMHLVRTLNTRCMSMSFQGPGTEPALSTDLVSGDLLMRDTYREKSTAGSEVHSFLISGMSNFVMDGLFHMFHAAQSKVLKSGQLGVQGRITNAQAMTSAAPSPSTVWLTNDTDDLVIDHAAEINYDTGEQGDISVTGDGALLMRIASPAPDPPNTPTIDLPSGSDEVFLITGSNPIAKITVVRPKRSVTLVFNSTASLLDGENLRLNGDFVGGADRSIALVCDDAYWYEVSRTDAGTPSVTTVASASTLTLPNASEDVFKISGTTTITTISAQAARRRVTLIFTSTAQLTDGSNLKLNGNFTGSGDRTITLVCDGTNWFESCRSSN